MLHRFPITLRLSRLIPYARNKRRWKLKGLQWFTNVKNAFISKHLMSSPETFILNNKIILKASYIFYVGNYVKQLGQNLNPAPDFWIVRDWSRCKGYSCEQDTVSFLKGCVALCKDRWLNLHQEHRACIYMHFGGKTLYQWFYWILWVFQHLVSLWSSVPWVPPWSSPAQV